MAGWESLEEEGGGVDGLGSVQESILKQRTDTDKAVQQERAHTAAAGHRACHRANRIPGKGPPDPGLSSAFCGCYFQL